MSARDVLAEVVNTWIRCAIGSQNIGQSLADVILADPRLGVVELPEPTHHPRHNEYSWKVHGDPYAVILDKFGGIDGETDDGGFAGPDHATEHAAALLAAARKAVSK